MSASREPNFRQAASRSLRQFLSQRSHSLLPPGDLQCVSPLRLLHYRGCSRRVRVVLVQAITSHPRPGAGLARGRCWTTLSCIQALNKCISDDGFFPGFSSLSRPLHSPHFPLGDLPGSKFRGSRQGFAVCPGERTPTSLALAGQQDQCWKPGRHCCLLSPALPAPGDGPDVSRPAGLHHPLPHALSPQPSGQLKPMRKSPESSQSCIPVLCLSLAFKAPSDKSSNHLFQAFGAIAIVIEKVYRALHWGCMPPWNTDSICLRPNSYSIHIR